MQKEMPTQKTKDRKGFFEDRNRVFVERVGCGDLRKGRLILSCLGSWFILVSIYIFLFEPFTESAYRHDRTLEWLFFPPMAVFAIYKMFVWARGSNKTE